LHVAVSPIIQISAGQRKRGGGTSHVTEDELFETANIYPADSGLPMTVWIGKRGGARRDVRVKVNMAHGNQRSIGNTAVVGEWIRLKKQRLQRTGKPDLGHRIWPPDAAVAVGLFKLTLKPMDAPQ
jgi:hypothetical protein